MRIDELITEIGSVTRMLVSQQLRSKAAVLAELLPLIEEASARGITHQKIHGALVEANLSITFGYYETARLRVRARSHGRSNKEETVGKPELETPRQASSFGSQEPKQALPQEQARPTGTSEPLKEGDAFAVRDALKEAQLVSQTDYRKFARSNKYLKK